MLEHLCNEITRSLENVFKEYLIMWGKAMRHAKKAGYKTCVIFLLKNKPQVITHMTRKK